jgi:CheY-like chemotaxis protein
MARVLVVDDDPDLLTLVELQLRHHGHEVTTANGGEQALALVDANGRPDVAVLDVAMPGMNGFELLETLRRRPATTGLPAVFLSARVSARDVDKGRSLDALYLTKPYVMHALLEAIEKLVTGGVGSAAGS